MATDIAAVLQAEREALAAGTVERLVGPAESCGRAAELSGRVATCVDALCAAAEATRPAILLEAAVAVARGESEPVEGYRRSLRLLEVICSEAARALKRVLPADEARLAVGRLRALVGPAELGLAVVLREAPEPVGSRLAEREGT